MEHELKNESSLVEFDGDDDPYLPVNWPTRKKITTTLLYSFCTMCTTWAGTIYNSGLPQIEPQFHVGQEVAILGLTLYLAGNAFGPLLWGPMSEAFGRRISVLIPVFALMLFTFASASAKDIQTLLITRFFAGVFGCAPQSNGGGVMADIWRPAHRGGAIIVWSMAVIVGPLVAPIIGGALVVSLHETGWRWILYLTGMLIAVILSFSVVLIDESYPPVLLQRKASRLRLETKNWALHSESEEHGTSLREMAKKYLIVPLEMLMEPLCFFVSIYAAFCYAMVYLSLFAFDIEFQEVRGWNEVVGSVPFTAVIIGVFFATIIIYISQNYYRKVLIANNNQPVPEARLLPMMIGSVPFAAGLFIMGWTSSADIHWIGFCIGSTLFGVGFFTIFLASVNYLVDTYMLLAASAIAANLFLRSVLAAAFPLFAGALFDHLGLDWGMSLLGFVASAMIPIPFLFFVFGKRIRTRGKWSKKFATQ